MLLPQATPLSEVLQHEIAKGDLFIERTVFYLAIKHSQYKFTIAIGLLHPSLNDWSKLHCPLAGFAAILSDEAV
jgi:hypothetical protein